MEGRSQEPWRNWLGCHRPSVDRKYKEVGWRDGVACVNA